MTYANYKKHIRPLLAEYGRKGILNGVIPVKFFAAEGIPVNEGGIIRAREPDLMFRDGAKLKLYEMIHVVKNEISRLEYSYHYERPGGYFFRYEREETTDLIRKPAYHMHVILDLPHFVAPPVNLEIILKMIAANFYATEIYSKQIIRQEIHLTFDRVILFFDSFLYSLSSYFTILASFAKRQNNSEMICQLVYEINWVERIERIFYKHPPE